MTKVLTKNISEKGEPLALSIQEYETRGGYQAIRNMFKNMASLDVQKKVKDAGLRGRGGAGFPTGIKWGLVPMGENAPKVKYYVANGDEMEPGTFKDRLLLENDPHQFIEGMICGSYAIGATTAYLFVRGEYYLAAERVNNALKEAYNKGYLGNNILGSGYNLEMYVHTSAGRYICGEETALINSLEGRRAHPRAKPPFPQISGLFGKPTVVNNVETICNLSHIIAHDAAWFKSLSKNADGGTKLYGASGKVKRPGTWELPMGVSIREVFEECAGGMRDGLQLKAFLPGGASTDFLLAEHLDLPFDYDNVAKAGSRMGTGQMIVLDDQTPLIGALRNLENFFARESCGWCSPCRDGLPWVEKILIAMEQGKGRPEHLTMLSRATRMLGPGKTFCAHAPGAMEPLQSAMKYFKKEMEQLANVPA